MAQYTITIPDDMALSFATYKGYIENDSETAIQYTQRKNIEWLRNGVKRKRADIASKASEEEIMNQDFNEIN